MSNPNNEQRVEGVPAHDAGMTLVQAFVTRILST